LVRIVEAILRDQSTVLSVSSYIDGFVGISDVCLSLPTVINRSGVVRPIHLELSADEAEGLRMSANVLKNLIQQLKLNGS